MWRIKHRKTGKIETVTEEVYKTLQAKKMFADNFFFLPPPASPEVAQLSAEELISRHMPTYIEPTEPAEKPTEPAPKTAAKKPRKKIDNTNK